MVPVLLKPFFSILSVQCDVSNGADRKECGYVGIGRDECFTKGCCWDPLPNGQNGAWCYESPSKLIRLIKRVFHFLIFGFLVVGEVVD